jgi:hypothetical protein
MIYLMLLFFFFLYLGTSNIQEFEISDLLKSINNK